MKIRSVQAYLMSEPGTGSPARRDAMLVMVEGEGGLCGYGPGPATEAALAAVETVIAPFLEGRTLRDTDALRILLHQQAGVTQTVARVYDAVELALHDLTARSFGVALCDLLGGPVRDEVRLYEPVTAATPAAAVETARLFRAKHGEHADLMLDGRNWWAEPEETIHQAARELAGYQLTWLQDPLPPTNHGAWSRLEALGDVPLAGGRFEPDEMGLDDLIARRCVSVLQGDLVRQGGFHRMRPRVASISRSGLQFVLVNSGTELGALVAAHLAVCWPESVVPYLEAPQGQGLAVEILSEHLAIHEGVLELDTSRPGLGIEINLDAIQQFPWVP